MIKAYIIQKVLSHLDFETINNHIDEIKRCKPNRIFIISLGEINVMYNNHFLFEGLKDWLQENNVTIFVLWAGPDKELLPNVHGINTLGSAVGNYWCTYGATNLAKHVNFLELATKLYTSYNHNASYERKYFVDHLVKENLLDQGIVTYHYPTYVKEYNWQYHNGSKLMDEPDYVIHGNVHFSPAILPKNYFRGFIDIVTETQTPEGYYIPTEKTAKPWGAGKPYLVVSSQNYHQWLFDEYGIEPYTEMFDYSFDKEKKVEDRIQGILHNLKTWHKTFTSNASAKIEIYNKILPKLKTNRKMALDVMKTLKSKNKVIPNCLRFITEERYILLGETKNTGNDLHFFMDPEWHKQYG